MELSLLIASAMTALMMAWAIGAQDVSNALGTSVGSKALTVRQAIVVGAVCEFLGSLVGGEVAGTISGGILNPGLFSGPSGIDLYARLMFTTMAGAFTWLGIATYFALPVSTTHSLVGSLIGVGVIAKSWTAIQFHSVAVIVSSWISSPLMGGAISYVLFSAIHTHILSAPRPARAAQDLLPLFTGGTVGTLAAFLGLSGPKAYRVAPSTAAAAGLAVAVVVAVAQKQTRLGLTLRATAANDVLPADAAAANDTLPAADATAAAANDGRVPGGKASPPPIRGKRRTRPGQAASPSTSRRTLHGSRSAPDVRGPGGAQATASAWTPDDPEACDDAGAAIAATERLFLPLMVTTACVVSFAHGSNDVSNSIGPFTAIAEIYATGAVSSAPAPLWVLLGGGVGIVVGLGTYGYKVMATVGEGITRLTFTRGFAAQIGTAFTVLTATQIGVSVSTTHSLIGAISGVALVEGSDKLNVATLKRIAMSWAITIPASAFFSIILYMTMELVSPIPDA